MKIIFKGAIFLVIVVSCIFILGKEKVVFAGNEACAPITPVCWPSRSVDEWACNSCPEPVWLCDDGIHTPVIPCSGSGDPICNLYSGLCVHLCGTLGWVTGVCNLLNTPVSCDKISTGYCEYTGDLLNCNWSGDKCHEGIGEPGHMSCCGPGVLPTASPAPTEPPPGTCQYCGTYPDCSTPYCDDSICTCGCSATSCSGGVCQPCVESCTLSLTPATASIAAGGTKTLTATVVPTNGTVDHVDFVSGTSTVATVSPASDSISPYTTVATGVGGGTSTITATATMDDGSTHCSDTSTVTVRSCTVSLAPATANVGIGGTQSLAATVTPIGDTISSVGFVSGTPAVATVSPTSDATAPYDTTVTGVSNGSSTVTATATMSLGGTCFDTSDISVAACTVTLTPNPKTLSTGDTWPFTATVTNISPTSVSFVSSNPSAVTVSPASDASAPYITTGTAVAAGSSTLTASAILGGVTECSDTSDITVNNAKAWWQVKDGDVTTNGDITSAVPAGLYFDVNGDGGYAGVPTYGVSTDLTGVNVSVNEWLVNSGYNASKAYNSAYFLNAMPADTTINSLPGSTINGTDLSSGGTATNGIYWYVYDPASFGGSDLTINNAVNLGARKVVLITKGADVNIKGDINLTKGTGFFLLVAGETAGGAKGDILVDASVGGGGAANLEGVFVADEKFQTGIAATQLWIRGTVVAYGGALLQRDLGAANATKTAEYFEFAPDLALLFPKSLGVHAMNWQEVAP